MKKIQRIAFFDQDQTIYDGFSMFDFYLFMADNKLVGSWVYKRHKEILDQYWSKKLSYQKAGEMVVQLAADCLADKQVKEIERLGKKFVNNKSKILPWVSPVLKYLHQKGFKSYIISGSVHPVVKAVGDHIKVTGFFGSTLEILGGYYTGKVIGYLDSKEKLKPVEKILSKIGKKSLKIGFGDSTGDIEMLSRMDYGFIINPHQPEIYKIAKEKNWLINQDADTIIKRLNVLINRS